MILTASRSPVYRKEPHRMWSRINSEQFIAKLKAFPLCQPADPSRTATELANCYQSEITNILDNLVPVTEMSVRLCP